ncbi:HigA family addiction module antitoxin [Desulfoferrobacter suflitae]|uniref:HigA family addiction module antitoxin n=1 Tax=Desulfoferrobacter suflitae TaxID=2865782 RepID=UPI00338DB003|nr:HigA family addiction module antitoxin [Desulfoferrobacter suflitae]
MNAVHPGRILGRELNARNITVEDLASALRMPTGQISQILNAKRGITAETALRLAQYFGNSAQFWMNLQSRYDLIMVEQEKGAQIRAEVVKAA